MQIVIAKVEMSGIEFTGKYLDRYCTEPEIRRIPQAKGCMWLNDGGPTDVDKAKEFAKTEGYTVYTFQGEKDPVGKAKSLELARVKA